MEVKFDMTSKRIDNAITMAVGAHKKKTQSKRWATTDKSTARKRRETPAITPARPTTTTPATAIPAPVNSNLYIRCVEFLWGSKEFRTDRECSKGQKE